MSALWERGLREGRKPSTILPNTTRLSGGILRGDVRLYNLLFSQG